MFVQTKQAWCIARNSLIWMSMKSGVYLPKTGKLFQLMTSMNSLCVGNLKSLDYTISNTFEVLRIELK